jgi:hypothetical protein
MAELIRVRIDFPKLTANLSAAERAVVTEDDVKEFLKRNAFTSLGGDVWTCEDITLRLLDRSEILEVKTE